MRHYYYAGGDRIELEDDDEHVVVDTALAPVDLVTELALASSRMPGGMIVTPKSSLRATDLARLKQSGALHPIFRKGGALMVPMAEVRVEFDDESQRAAVLRVLKKSGQDVVVSDSSNDRVVFAPASGDPLDALDLANDIYESVHPNASSVRFVQVVPRPKRSPE